MNQDNRRQGDIVANLSIHIQMLLSGLDDLEGETIFRNQLKHFSNKLKNELERVIDNIHKDTDPETNKAMLSCYDDYLYIINEMDHLTVQERSILRNQLPTFIQQIKTQKINQ